MTKPSVLRVRAVRVSVMAAAVIAVGAPAPALAADTFSGTCEGLEGWAVWEHPLSFAPVDMRLRGDLSGGQCSGTVNGRDVDSRPAAALLELRGTHSCGGAIAAGRFTFKLAGRTFTGKMTYRRVTSRVVALWEGDGGGSAVLVIHARIGFVSQDDPLASTPLVGPIVSDRMSAQEAIRRCVNEGIKRQRVLIDQIVTNGSLSG
jgi:hypothetical protein